MRSWNELVWAQFDAAIETLRNAIEACSEKAWRAPCGGVEVWHAALHAVFFLDLYSGRGTATYEPPEPFTRSELEEDARPPRMYTKDELLGFLEHARAQCRARIESLTDADREEPSGFEWLAKRGLSVAETVLYSLRHVQHHAAQLNLVLRQVQDQGARWIHRSGAALAGHGGG